MNISKLQLYQTENADLKEQARDLLVDQLGYEPDLRASWKSELHLRDSIKRLKEGTLSQSLLRKHVESFADIVEMHMKDIHNQS